MNSLYSFRCRVQKTDHGASTLFVFSGPGDFNISDLTTAVSDQTRNDLSPQLVILLYPEELEDHLVNLPVEDIEDVFSPIAVEVPIGAYAYNQRGEIRLLRAFRDNPPQSLDLEAIRRQGMTKLFRDRGALLEAGPTAHFVKPSGRSDSRFLRAAHALSEGAEIFFCAFWLLKYFEKDVDRIHVDTSAIASVALAAVIMTRRKSVPLITTFQSYEGKETHPFDKERKELVLISASQSGSLAESIATKVSDPNLVITMFSAAPTVVGETTVLAHLIYDADLNPGGIGPSSSPIDELNSRPINLIGEHFHAAAEVPRAITPTIRDRPDSVKEFLHKLVGHKVIRAFKPSLIANERRAIWVDVEKLVATPAFENWNRKLVAMEIPASTRAIISFSNDPSSVTLANAVKTEVEAQGGKLVDCAALTLTEIETGSNPWSVKESPVVIVGGATGHGSEFLMASRALRSYAANSHRVYVTTVAMPSSHHSSTALEKNLTQPTHKFHKWFDLFVDRERLAESWHEEHKLLREHAESLPDSLSKRLVSLESSAGLVDELFLDGSHGTLKLRHNFAFWPRQTDCNKSTQADVFATIAAILANIRTGEKTPTSNRLINDAYNQSVLAAETFFRFNDGIIQACMMRASLPIELDYRNAPRESNLMADLIMRMIELSNLSHGEALSEFLLALALKRIKLMSRNEHCVREKLHSANETLSQQDKWIAEKISWTS